MWRRYACVRQTGQSDCGAAALATVALHYRRPIALQQMRDLAGTDRIGTNLLGLLQAAEALGFSAKGVKGPYEALPQVPLPAIAHVKTEEGLGHFLVLYRVKKDAVVVADPARGIQKLSRDEFCRRWTGYLLLLVPEQQALPRHARQRAGQSVAAVPGPARRPHPGPGRGLLLCPAHDGAGGLHLLLHPAPGGLRAGPARGAVAQRPGHRHGADRPLPDPLRHAPPVPGGLRRPQGDLALIAGYARHLLGLPLRFFEMRRVGEILSRVNDAAKVREAISGTTLTAVVDGTLVVLLLVVLWLYDGPLALVATAFVPVLVLSAVVHHPAARRRSREAMEDAAQLSAHLVEDVSGVETVKAFGAERLRAEEGETRLVGWSRRSSPSQKLGISMNTLGTFVTAMAGLVVLWYGGHRVMDGALTIGQLMFFYSLLGYLLGPLERLASVNLKLQDALVAVDRLYQIMDLEVEPLGDRQQADVRGGPRGHRAAGRELPLRLPRERPGAGDLRIPAGKTVAVVGESGSGKSTLLKLLMGFYAPTAGRILIDGVDLRDFDLASLRSRIGLVSQEPFIFNGTLRENIALGRPGATLEEVIAAARAAGLEEFIAGLPERYETVIGERGANLSGGQRQRLAIARALLRQPEILIFDEATSHLDTATERAIQESLRTALAGKTVVLVAHRLSTIKDADLIYVLHRGRVVQQGTHRQLLAQEGLYRTLWRAQTDEADDPLHLPAAMASASGRNGHGPASLEGVQPCVTT